MAELRKILAWFFFYLMATLFSMITALSGAELVWPGYDISEKSAGPVESQFYFLLVDRGYWTTGKFRDSNFRERISEQGRERYAAYLNTIRFKRDCRSGQEKANGEGMHCTINGKEINFTSDN